jgi:hypothetical protein
VAAAAAEMKKQVLIRSRETYGRFTKAAAPRQVQIAARLSF